MARKTKEAGEITIADIASTLDPFVLLRKINPLLESEDEAPTRIHAAIHYLASTLLDGASVMKDEQRDGLGYLLLTVGEAMSLHWNGVVARRQDAERCSSDPVAKMIANAEVARYVDIYREMQKLSADALISRLRDWEVSVKKTGDDEYKIIWPDNTAKGLASVLAMLKFGMEHYHVSMDVPEVTP